MNTLYLQHRLLARKVIQNMGFITPCWLWTGAIHKRTGYGVTSVDNRSELVHRVAAELWLPNFNRRLCTLHKCDIRRCINPEHLFQGTRKDNNKDTALKGRHGKQR
jgi:HNH endonuclease